MTERIYPFIPRRGQTFVHQKMLDQNSQPMTMRITRVTPFAVHFTHDPDSRGRWYLDRSVFVDRYADQIEPIGGAK